MRSDFGFQPLSVIQKVFLYFCKGKNQSPSLFKLNVKSCLYNYKYTEMAIVGN